MKQTLQLRLGQHLAMTPQLQQAIRLLQLSTIELQTEIQDALDSNMMLETVEDERDDPSSRQAESDGEAAGENAPAQEATDIPDDLPVDTTWDEIYESSFNSPGMQGADYSAMSQDVNVSSPETLQEHLYSQLELTPFSEVDRAIATAIIDAVNDDGLLTEDLDVIKQTLGDDYELEDDEVEAVLHRIQQFDPIGIAARDLRECLLIQLSHLPADTPWLAEARKLISEYMDRLAVHDYAQLTRSMRLSRDDLQAVIEVVQTLNPRPGGQIHSPAAQYVIPDVYVRQVKNKWVVELNPDATPKLRINPVYAGFIKRGANGSEGASMKTHLQEARWFIKSLQSRCDTLLRVAECIVKKQEGFFEEGDSAMKPLVLHDVAEVVEMHESTISRVTTRKYMHTPRGIFELKYFFSSNVGSESGDENSSTAIRAHIKGLITEENSLKPLSDNKIATILAERGISVARRTVAKYREAMAIPPSNERKRLV